eukprot:scaffold36120_cov15-Tisochrysis_lutea.AAC.2
MDCCHDMGCTTTHVLPSWEAISLPVGWAGNKEGQDAQVPELAILGRDTKLRIFKKLKGSTDAHPSRSCAQLGPARMKAYLGEKS